MARNRVSGLRNVYERLSIMGNDEWAVITSDGSLEERFLSLLQEN